MEIFLISGLLVFGFFCSYLSAVLSYLSQDQLSKIADNNAKTGKKLQHIKLHFEDTANPFNLYEMLSYLGSGIFIGAYVFDKGAIVLSSTLVALFFFTIFARYIIYALGIRMANKSAQGLFPIFSILCKLSQPFTRLIETITLAIGGAAAEEAPREEISALMESAHEEGALDADEYRFLKNVMHFSEVPVSDVMTPRTIVYSAEADKTVHEIVRQPELKLYSRFPIWEGNSMDDGVIGYVMTKDLLHEALNGNGGKKLRDIAREAYFIPENAELDKALDKFLKRRQHLFVVVDEYGGVEGLLTMEDVLETILGVEIVDEADKFVDLRAIAKQRRDRRIASLPSQ